ncbi:MAG TPA: phospholipase D-like domain-containing protein [Candidatus Tectomicrobia bacterium]|nr:phospholipase D-like domain-containing protein [Candidatus Tectomicrobia bacterium]
MPGRRPVSLALALLVAPALLAILAACARPPAPRAFPDLPLAGRAWQAALARYAAAPVVGGNRVDVLVDGHEIFTAMLAAVRTARRTITYEQFAYKKGAVGRLLAETLAERCRAGVAVHVLIDAWGARWTPDHYIALMREAGCQVVDDFRPLRLSGLARANFRTHRRVLVVDGRIGFTGGSGVEPRWLGDLPDHERWRETDVRLEGPVVHQLQGAFAEHWLEATGVLLGGDAYYPPPEEVGAVAAHVIRSSPVSGNFALSTALLFAIESARRSIYITNQYLVLDERMEDALGRAVARGVDVAVIVPGRATNLLVFAAGRAGFGRLLDRGVEIYAYQRGLLHAKTAVIDGRWATVGSTNLDPRSLAVNDELNVVTYDAAVAQRLEDLFAQDLAASRRVTREAWEGRPMKLRLLEWLVAPLRGQL